MALVFPYKVVTVHHAVVPLGGRWSRPRPVVTVSAIGPKNAFPMVGRLDTGSDDTVFPERLASIIGVDLSNAPIGQSRTANMTPITVRYAQITLRITDGIERREWPAWVGFTPAVQQPLLGFAGFLQFFTAAFHGDREVVELTVNNLYQGN
jgi:hypothetical protein